MWFSFESLRVEDECDKSEQPIDWLIDNFLHLFHFIHSMAFFSNIIWLLHLKISEFWSETKKTPWENNQWQTCLWLFVSFHYSKANENKTNHFILAEVCVVCRFVYSWSPWCQSRLSGPSSTTWTADLSSASPKPQLNAIPSPQVTCLHLFYWRTKRATRSICSRKVVSALSIFSVLPVSIT